MAPRRTQLLLEVKWDDEVIDHPGGWDWPALCASNPFEPETQVRVKSFMDVDEDGNPEQV